MKSPQNYNQVLHKITETHKQNAEKIQVNNAVRGYKVYGRN